MSQSYKSLQCVKAKRAKEQAAKHKVDLHGQDSLNETEKLHYENHLLRLNKDLTRKKKN